MKPPFFTVLIDAYNYGEFVEEAVPSVPAQDFVAEKREILVVDDGSQDDTQERLQKFGDKIRYLRKPNGGQASAFNLGFENARGEVIALLDADDVWLPGDLGRVYEEFQRQPAAGMVYHRADLWNGPTFPTILISFQSRDACGRTGARCCNTQWWAHRADVKRFKSCCRCRNVAISGGCLFVGTSDICCTRGGGAGVPRQVPDYYWGRKFA